MCFVGDNFLANLFVLLFVISIVITIILLIKPSLTALRGKPALSRGKISLYGIIAIITSFILVGIFAPPIEHKEEKVNQDRPAKKVLPAVSQPIESTQSIEQQPKIEKPQAEIDQEAKDYREKIKAQHQELANEDKPHIETPAVDYTKAIAKIDLNNDKAILKAVGKAVVDKESISNENGEPATTYYFSQNLVNGLDITLSREFIDINWRFDAKDKEKAAAAFNDGQQITRALLGGKEGSALYEKISKGEKFEQLILEDGTEVKKARCGQFICRYQVVR